ncbi:alpha-hydroxy-acid oxidizing enzyme [Rhodoferax lacus]|uniref:Alpha-hydroxy-acid oxidizing enzyme n=1 Tax=Rhodoferax lacus TaxID=2184758 RepID=A0A3E1RFH4_9BURK|nr:alpha-hydroxy acid oxidase [Rhodoferax lacus]RFO98135.1 alpha-hydroxy-acid oxidizing enzyme [Rhodoferax lacus]
MSAPGADARAVQVAEAEGLAALACVESVDAYRALARARLAPGIWNYLDEDDSAGNVQALQQSRLMPRPLCDVRGGHTRVSLFGQVLQHPLLLAPIAYQRLFHVQGECASAMASAAQGGQCVLSSLASQPFADIVSAARAGSGEAGAGAWFQLYWQGNRERTVRLLQRALNAGCSAIVFTVDAPIKRATLVLPAHVQAVNLEPADARGAASALPLHAASSQVFGGWMAEAPTWDDVRWLRSQTGLPLLLKGLLHPDDAQAALDAGCDGIVVSNHGGRVLAGAPISLQALDAIVQRVAGRVPVLFDSGVRSGRDVFVALAHGAAAVLLGRPYVWGLAAQGALGVAHVIRLLRDDLEMTMALTGCAQLADIGPHCLSPVSYIA